MNELPVAVIGAGPVGLAAAAELSERGIEPVLLERGSEAGAAISAWGHVRLFSRWAELVAPAAERLLTPTGWRRPPDDSYPTGAEWVRSYLRPLADALGERVRYDAEVVGVTRRGRDRVVDAGRDSEPLVVRVRSRDGGEQQLTVRAVIDASGTSGYPNPLGADGLPALGERFDDDRSADRFSYRIPSPDDRAAVERYAGAHVAVVGSGHSAQTALITLAELGARLTWVLRRESVGNAFGGGTADQLPARGALGQRARRLVTEGRVRLVNGFRTEAVENAAPDRTDESDRRAPEGQAGRLDLVSTDGSRIEDIDQVVVLTGFRPDLSWLSELRLELDSTLQAPTRLAPLIDPNVHSCGTVYPHGVRELAHPEPNVFLAGMKSYGRAPTFLALTGYEQVRSIAAALAGDQRSAERVELTLPETGVCGGAGLADEPDTPAIADVGGCCQPGEPEPIQLSTSPSAPPSITA